MNNTKEITNAKRRLRYYYRNIMTAEQMRELIPLFADVNELLFRICTAYNDYKVCSGRWRMSMITNPEALFSSFEAKEQFVIEIKNYISDVIGITREDVQYGRVDNNRSISNDTQN